MGGGLSRNENPWLDAGNDMDKSVAVSAIVMDPSMPAAPAIISPDGESRIISERLAREGMGAL